MYNSCTLEIFGGKYNHENNHFYVKIVNIGYINYYWFIRERVIYFLKEVLHKSASARKKIWGKIFKNKITEDRKVEKDTTVHGK